MGERVRLWVGGSIAAVGLVMWAIATAVLEPGIIASLDTILTNLERLKLTGVGAEEQGQFLIWGKELRWSAIVLAVAGVALTVQRLATAPVAAAMAAGLFTADVLLDRSVHRSGWGYAAILAAAALAVAALGVFALARRHVPRPNDHAWASPLLLTSAAITASVAPLQVWNMRPELRSWLPAGMPAFVLVLTVLLVLATVLCGLAAARRPRFAGAAWLFGVGAALLTAYGWYRLAGGDSLFGIDTRFAPNVWTFHIWMPTVIITPLLVGGAVLLARGGARRWYGWAALTVAFVVTTVAAPMATIPGYAASFTWTRQVLAGLGEYPYSDVLFPLFGAVSLALAAAVGAAILTSMLLLGRRPADEPAPAVVPPLVLVPATLRVEGS